MTCSGCKEERPQEPEEDAGMAEKLERLSAEGISVIHIGVCRVQTDGQECERMIKIGNMLETRGIRVVRGTHRE